MNQRDFLLTKINSGKAELEQMPAFMKMERELLQADIKEWEEELAKIPPGPNGEKIYFLNRQINAAKDYLRRLHPRFEEERKQREEFIQQKETELKEMEKENGAKTPQLEPCPFCGSMPVEYNGCIRCEAPDCYVQPGIKSEMPEFLPKLWNQMAMIDCEDDKPESDKFHQPYLNPCVRCGGLGLFEGNATSGRAWCYSCDNEIIIKGKTNPKQIIDAWNEENPIPNLCVKCGIPPKRRNYPGLAIVHCPECMNSSVGETMAKAVRKWNEKNPEEVEKPKSQNETIKMVGPFKPCAKCGSPVEWEMSLSGRRGWVKCPRCGNEMTVDDEEHHTMEEWVEMWNQVNTKPKADNPEMPSVNWLFNIPSDVTQMLVIKLELLNSVLGLQRDEEGPVYVVNAIQDVLIEMIHTIEEGKNWFAGDEIQVLQIEIDKIKKDHVLELPKEQTIAVHGSYYVTNLHIARAVCREAELYAWDYEQKKGIEKMSQIPEYLNRLGDWLFVKAEYLRETEECF